MPGVDLLPPMRRRLALTLWLLLAVATGCGASTTGSDATAAVAGPLDAETTPSTDGVGTDDLQAPQSDDAVAAPAAGTTAEATTAPLPMPTATPHPLAVGAVELPQAPIGFEALATAEPAGPQPISIRIEDIGVAEAAVIPVGVNVDLTFEVPPADQVGWYEFGPRPGEEGSSVLAAHIAYNGVDGVFRYLANVEVGSIVEVGFADGTSQRYRIDQVVEYLKDELPDSLFARTGDPQLALITCGGDFNRQLSSYESNTVAIATPIT